MNLAEFYEIVRSLWVVWLMILFAGIVFWAFRPKNKQRLRRLMQMFSMSCASATRSIW